MAASMASPRGRSIREAVLESVAAYHQQQRMKRKFRKSLSYAGELSSAGRALGEGASSSSSATSLCRPEEDEPFWEEEEEGTVELVQIGASRAKNVLILMSDTSGGHRASAEAIKDYFRIECGLDLVFVKDLCKDHAGWPLNNMESSYEFMVKHVQLWKVAFHSTSPRWVHCFYLAALASFYANVTGGNLHCGTPINPASPSLVPGGSCSGSAVAVFAQIIDFALGTDTTGDVRLPASFCGVLCFRPSHGVVSTLGTLANSQTLDTIGIFLPLPVIYVCMFITYNDNHFIFHVFYGTSCLASMCMCLVGHVTIEVKSVLSFYKRSDGIFF